MFEEWAKRDPIERFRWWLRDNASLSDEEEDEITSSVKRTTHEAVERAEESPFPDPSTLLEGVFATPEELDTPHHVYPHVPDYERVVLLENDGARPPNTDVWHTDLTFKPNPPFASILHAKAIPACGGDTLWCSMYAAYDALSDGMKADLCDLSAVHATGSYWNQFFAQGGLKRLNEGMAAMGAAVHQIVARHPVTGKPFSMSIAISLRTCWGCPAVTVSAS